MYGTLDYFSIFSRVNPIFTATYWIRIRIRVKNRIPIRVRIRIELMILIRIRSYLGDVLFYVPIGFKALVPSDPYVFGPPDFFII
jgi:hypothetical protein